VRWPRAALRGLMKLSAASELDASTARRIVGDLWVLFGPRPTQALSAEAWRELFTAVGPFIDESAWKRPDQLVIYRGSAMRTLLALAGTGRSSLLWLVSTPRA
jgi:hypothetical protein